MIGVFGVSHHTAPVELREQLSLLPEERELLSRQWRDSGLLSGAIVLSTCNRLEVYYETEHSRGKILSQTLSRSICSLRTPAIEDSVYQASYHLLGAEAVRHMYRLASGLDSMVVGETQILGQLKSAFRETIDQGRSTSLLSRLCHKCFEAAKHIRSEYLVSATPRSAGASAVDLLHQRGEISPQSTILIIGAGQMAESIYNRLQQQSISRLSLYNRSRERGERFVEEHRGLTLYTGQSLYDAMQEHSVIFVATSALHPIITPELISPDRRYILVDLGVPRNVDSSLESHPSCQVYTIDSLARDQSVEIEIKQQVHKAIEEHVQEFVRWWDASEIRTVISTIQQASEGILARELKGLSSIPKEEYQKLEQHCSHLKTTFSTAIITSLRQVTDDGRNTRFTEAINALFSHIAHNYPTDFD